jgi:hypothetical protein
MKRADGYESMSNAFCEPWTTGWEGDTFMKLPLQLVERFDNASSRDELSHAEWDREDES